MKIFVSALAASLTAPLMASAINVGVPAPAFQARDAAGKPINLSAYRGKTVVLEWTNNGCPFVGHMYSSGVMQHLQHEAATSGAVWLTVISSAPGKQGYLTGAEVAPWKARVGAAPADVLLDPTGDLGHAYDARATPDMYVIDREGRLVYAGAIDDTPSTNPADARTAKNYVVGALAALRSGHPVSPAVTKPYGCSIKYR
jgi:hypothetical protein